MSEEYEDVETPLSAEEIFEQHQAEINEMFEEKGFFARLSAMFKGLKMPRSSREYKQARTELQRLAAPLVAILLPVLGVIVLIVITAVQGERREIVQVEVGQIEESHEDLDEPEPEPEELDMQEDVDVNVEVTVETAPQMVSPAPPSPNPGGEPDKVAAPPSPVTMSAVAGTVKMRGLGDGDGGGFGTIIGGGKGGGQNIEGCLIGRIIDFKSNPDGTPNPAYNCESFYRSAIKKLAAENFSAASLAPYFVPEKRVALNKLVIPSQKAENGPKAFGVADVMKPSGFLVVYQGEIIPEKTQKFRFWGSFDDVMLIQVNGKTVQDSSWNGYDGAFGTSWSSGSDDGIKVRPYQTNAKFTPSDWIDGVAGKPIELLLAVGERPGGLVGGYLFIQVEGVEYPKKGGFTDFPVFASRRLSFKEKDAMRSASYSVNVDDIPIFNSKKSKRAMRDAVKNDVKIEIDI